MTQPMAARKSTARLQPHRNLQDVLIVKVNTL